jgi:hypothetical protein
MSAGSADDQRLASLSPRLRSAAAPKSTRGSGSSGRASRAQRSTPTVAFADQNDVAEPEPKKKNKRLLKQLEVHEGVDMYKEYIADEAKKQKQILALRAVPK